MPTLTRISLALLIAATPLGCGGSTRQDAGTGGSAGSTGGSAAGGAGGSGASAGSGGSGGGTGGTSCAAYADETATGSVTVRFQNARATPIYLGAENTCSPVPLFNLSGPIGSVQMHASGCGHTCQALQQHGDWCTDACFIPPVVVINPGGSYDATWSGTTHVAEKMPTSCYFEPMYAPPSCDRRIIAPAGGYVAQAAAANAMLCNDVGICACTPNAQGSCEIPYGAQLSGTPLEAKASFEMPGASLVVITFD